MAENTEHTLSTYLGPEFQQRLIWQLLVEPEFAEKTIPNLAIEYFDDPYLKRLFIIILEYFKANEKVPNLQNQSIQQAINTYKTPNNIIEEESLFAVIKKIELWNERIINKQILYEGDVVRRETSNFIKQQEYRKTGEFILTSTKNGDIRKKTTIASIEEKFQKIQHIGDDEDYGISVFDNIEHVLRKEFRQTIPTGIGVIDTLTGGGLGKGEIGIVLSPSGVGKALPNSHKVLTINGWVENGSLSVNDIVFGSNGKPQTILGVFPQGKRKIYKIVFSDQTTAYCDAEHLWSVNSFNQRNQKTNIRGKTLSIPDHTFQILKTSEIMEDVKIKGGLNYRLPNVLPIEFNKTDVKIDPYVMGILLGDGCLTKKNQPHIITSDLFIVDKICGLEKNIVVHEYEGRKENYKKLYRISLLNSRKILEDELNLYGTDSSTKFIPENYLHNCIEYREKLLQGLIDSDGGVGKNSAIIYSTVSKKLSENVRELVLSLGGTCRTTEKYKTYTNKEGLKVSGKNNYCLTISFPNNGIIPCTLPAKLNRVVIREKYEFNKFIKSVEYSHEEEATCIYVESNDHLYVIDDYILTHNTTILTKIANTAYDEGKNVAQIILEDTVEQVQRKHFAIWANSALSKMDEENENTRVNRIIHEKAIEMSGKGNLVIKKFSQENTTMMDIRNWMIGYQKKYGIKFNILVLDYLDVLDSHKKTHDRNEDELVIIKSFEALAADFEIPGWSAVQTNRCLGLNTKVNIEGIGEIKIGSVKIGDKILTAEGYKLITHVFPIEKQKTYKIKTKSGKEIICSKKHNFITPNNDLKAINFGLKIGDKLLVKNSLV
jgi:replicative DNA helicase